MAQASQKWSSAYAILIFKGEEGEIYEPLPGKLVQDRSESAYIHYKQAMMVSPHLSVEFLPNRAMEGCWQRIFTAFNTLEDEKENWGLKYHQLSAVCN